MPIPNSIRVPGTALASVLLAACAATPTSVVAGAEFLGVPVEVFVRQGDSTAARGLRQVLPGGPGNYRTLIDPAWATLFTFRGKKVYARKYGEHGLEDTLWEIPVENRGGALSFGEPKKSPYLSLSANFVGPEDGYGAGVDLAPYLALMNAPTAVVIGVRSQVYMELPATIEYRRDVGGTSQGVQIYTLDLLDADLEPMVTLHNTRGLPRAHGDGAMVAFDHPSGLPVTVFLDAKGRPRSPEMMGVTPFWQLFEDGVVGYAIPADAEHKRWIPLTAEGTIATEPLPCSGYLPHLGVPSRDLHLPKAIRGWLKEYALPNGKAYGWAALDLSDETGPLWRSMEEFYHGWDSSMPYDYVLIGQQLDGTWMVYDSHPRAFPPQRPALSVGQPTRDAALQAFLPIRNQRRAALAAAERIENEKRMVAWRQYVKDLGIDSFAGLTAAQASELPSQLYAIQGALGRRDYLEFDSLWQRLPGDYYYRYLLKAYNLGRVGVTPELARESAGRVRDPSLASTLRNLAADLEAQAVARAEAAKKAKEQAAAAAARARESVEAPPSWSGASASSLSASDRAYVQSSRSHEQYMTQMWNYLGGQSAWRPYR